MNENGLFVRPLPSFFGTSTLSRLCQLAKTDWKQDKIGEEEETWATKAIESLVKKLKKENNGSIEKLERALNNPDQYLECVTIPRSLDGRLQVNHKKSLPHVMYCRVWRWPDLQAHQELVSLAFCQNPYSSKQTTICVNPYHYARVEVEILPAVLVPRNNEYPSRKRNRILRRLSSQMCKWVGRNGNVDDSSSSVYSPSMVSSHSHPNSPYSCMSEEEQMQVDDCRQNQARMISPFSDHVEVDMTPMAARNMPVFQDHFNQMPKPSVWCHISYYELNSRVGEIFAVNPQFLTVTVDGFTNPSSRGDRFCLGVLSNIIRGKVIQQARDNIGKGIKITYDYRDEYSDENGDVYIECLSDHPVFVQSLNCNHFRGFHKFTICKIPPNKSLKIFDAKSYRQVLAEACRKLAELGDRRSEELNDRCSELKRMAFVQLSFARGWGAEYKHQYITSTPCWIEIRLNDPMKLYDQYIGSKLDGMPMSSVT